MSDFVQELRNVALHVYGGEGYLMERAADEIERLRARLAEVISERDDLRTMLLNERNERATDSEVNPRHICGAQGYNPMIDPPCPACTPDSATPRETASHE